jgi:hypothetical protein
MNFKEIGKVFTSKFVGTGPSSYKKKLPGRGLKGWETLVYAAAVNLLGKNANSRNLHLH